MKAILLIILFLIGLSSTGIGKPKKNNGKLFSLLTTLENNITTLKPFTQIIKELTKDEYKVFTDFFNTKNYSDPNSPQFFEYVYHGSVVFEKTFRLEKKDIDSLRGLEISFGKGIIPILSDFRLKNKEQCLIKDKKLNERVSILSEEQHKKDMEASKTLREVPSRSMSDIIYLSRVGFNKEKTAAIFYVSHSGSPITSYYVLMEKKGNAWTIRNAVMDNMIIF